MRSPFRRLVLIAIFASVWLTLAVIGLRKLGLQSDFQAFDHPLVKDPYWLIAWGGDSAEEKPMSLSAFLSASKLHPKIILGASVQSLANGELVIAEKHFIYNGSEVSFLRGMSFDTWKKLNPDGLTLKEFVTRFADSQLYLNLDRLNLLNYAVLIGDLEPLKDKKSVLIKSSPQGIKKKLKARHPWWLFSNTTAEIGKLKLMQALFLEPVASLNADFFVDKRFASRTVEEIRRRFKKAIYKPLADEADVVLNAKNYDGIVTTRPSDFISLVD